MHNTNTNFWFVDSAGLADSVVWTVRSVLSHNIQAEGDHRRQQAAEVDQEGRGQDVHPLSSNILMQEQRSTTICDNQVICMNQV